MGSLEEHTELVSACLTRLALMGYAAWANERRAVKINGRWVSIGKAGKGDIQVILSDLIHGKLIGTHGEVECKTGVATQKKDQRTHMRVVRNNGGVYILARSPDEMESEMAKLGFCARVFA